MSEINENIKHYFSIDSLLATTPPDNITSLDTRQALELLRNITTKVDNKYQVRLLWKYSPIPLPDNSKISLKTKHLLEAKMANDSKM